MKVALVSPPYHRFPSLAGFPSRFEPIGLEYIAGMANSYNLKFDILSDLPVDIPLAMESLDSYSVVGIGTSSVGVQWAIELARALKERNRHWTKVVLGGDHPSACPELVLDPAVDYVVRGEGEIAFTALVLALSEQQDEDSVIPSRHKIPGLVWQVGEGFDQNPLGPYGDIDRLPWPLRTESVLRECRLDGLAFPPLSSQQAVAQVIHSRGCNRGCSHCATRIIFGKGVRYRSAEDTAREIEHLVREYGTNLVFLADPNPLQDLSKMADLCRFLGERKPVSWYCSPDPPSITPESATMLQGSGCFKVALGVETLHEETYSRIRPWSNVDETRAAINIAAEAGLLVRAYCMVGIPGQTIFQFVESMEALAKLPVHEIRLAYYTPFPGTQEYERYKESGDLVSDDPSLCSAANPILNLPEFTVTQQEEAHGWALRRFYSGPEYASRWRQVCERFPSYEASFEEFFQYLRDYSIEVR